MMEKLMSIICGNLTLLQFEAEKNLKTVEGDSNLADLQGFIDGVNDVKYEMNLGEYFPDRYAMVNVEDLTQEQIAIFECAIRDFTRSTPKWESTIRHKEALIEEKKEFLFREAKKSRDLAYVTGWRHAVEYMDEYMKQIVQMYKAICDENPLFMQDLMAKVDNGEYEI